MMNGKIIFNKEGEKFVAGEHVALRHFPQVIHGKVTAVNGPFLILDIEEGIPPAEVRFVSRNITLYGYSPDKRQAALW